MKQKSNKTIEQELGEAHPIQFKVDRKVWIAAKRFVLESEDKTIQNLMTKLLVAHLTEKTGEKF